MGAKLRLIFGLCLLAIGVTGCALLDDLMPPGQSYDDEMRRAIYGPGGGIGRE